MNNKAKCALITGASSGCGYEYARIMAEKGYDLVIVSNENSIDIALLGNDALAAVCRGAKWL